MSRGPNQTPRILQVVGGLAAKLNRAVTVKEIATAACMTESSVHYYVGQAYERGRLLRTEQRGGAARFRYLYSLPPA